MSRLILYAPNIHSGGGLVLLESLLQAWPEDAVLTGFFDSRARHRLAIPANSDVSWVMPSVAGRLRSDWSLSAKGLPGDLVLCLHSLPPVFRCRAKVVVFMQNRNLVEPLSLTDFSLPVALRLFIERRICFLLRKTVDGFIVQTDSFRSLLMDWYGRGHRNISPVIRVLPFVEPVCAAEPGISQSDKQQFDFIYVADGLAQKNHTVLFDAWELMLEEGLTPRLALTLDGSERALLSRVEALQKKGVRVTNLGQLPRSKLIDVYLRSCALIYPSLRESFGLPLIEASQLNIPVIASELDYVYDVCRPCETFNPQSPHSIVRAVKRFLGVEQPVAYLYSAKEFLGVISSELVTGGDR